MKLLTAFALWLALFAITGRAPLDRAVYDNTKREPTANIDVYKDGQLPTRRFKVIGEITMPGHRDNELVRQQQITDEAKRMGGNGMIFVVVPAGVNALGVSEWVFKGKVIVYESKPE